LCTRTVETETRVHAQTATVAEEWRAVLSSANQSQAGRGVAHTLPVHVCIMPPRNIPLIVQTTQVHKDTPHLPRKCMHTCSLVRIQDPVYHAFMVVISKRQRREHARRIVGMRWRPNLERNCAGGGEKMRARRRRKIGRFS
jgi:hypothetical protein